MQHSAIQAELITRLPVRNRLGEGVLYHQASDSVYWTDIKGNALYCYDLTEQRLTQFAPPFAISAFGFTDKPGCLIVAFVHAIALYWPGSGKVEMLHEGESHLPGNRFNDGKVGPDGNFWIGTMVENPALNPPGASASLYRFDSQGQLTPAFDGIRISNGLCWSPDARVMYHADSPLGQIRRYDFADMPSSGALLVQTEPGASPDGSCTDSLGRIWNAQWGASQVCCYTADGQLLGKLSVPVSQPTCVALGGKQGNLLFVTSAWDELTDAERQAQPYAGDLFIYQVQAQALAEPQFTTPERMGS